MRSISKLSTSFCDDHRGFDRCLRRRADALKLWCFAITSSRNVGHKVFDLVEAAKKILFELRGKAKCGKIPGESLHLALSMRSASMLCWGNPLTTAESTAPAAPMRRSLFARAPANPQDIHGQIAGFQRQQAALISNSSAKPATAAVTSNNQVAEIEGGPELRSSPIRRYGGGLQLLANPCMRLYD